LLGGCLRFPFKVGKKSQIREGEFITHLGVLPQFNLEWRLLDQESLLKLKDGGQILLKTP
jgi:hypothetical protein